MVEWVDNNPYFLLIVPDAQDDFEVARIDLGERGWVARHSESGLLRAPATWYLVRKEGEIIVAMMLVLDGEQPYYLRRHVGFAGGVGAGSETSAFGIGKKRLDGHTDRIWILANGCVTLGDDLEPISIRMLKQRLL